MVIVSSLVMGRLFIGIGTKERWKDVERRLIVSFLFCSALLCAQLVMLVTEASSTKASAAIIVNRIDLRSISGLTVVEREWSQGRVLQ